MLPNSIAAKVNAKFLYFSTYSNHLSFGDSITEQSLWQSYFQYYSVTDSEIIKGYSGEALWNNCTMGSIMKKIGNENFSFCTVMFGTNDWGQSRAIGSIDDQNLNGSYTGTFMGSLNTFITNFRELYPEKIFLIVTPPFARMNQDYLNQLFKDDGTKNLAGFTIRDYADAIVDVCSLRGVPCFDFNDCCGWNNSNKAKYLTAEPNETYVHPNYEGAEVYAKKLSEFWKELQITYYDKYLK